MNTSSVGKKLRLGRLKYPGNDTGLIVPIDHGLTIGPVAGLERVSQVARWIGHRAICGIVAHKGMVERLAARDLLAGKAVFLHLNGMSNIAPVPNRKEMLSSVETAVHMGVDGVSVQLNFDIENDAHHLRLLGAVTDRAQRYGLPVLTMLYDKAAPEHPEKRLTRLNHLIRIAIELGSDAIKLAPPKSEDEMAGILDFAAEDAEIFFAGGELSSDAEILSLARHAARLGAAGLCAGRNIFQRDASRRILDQLRAVLLQEPVDMLPLPGLTFGHYSEQRV
jgi:class I fructose-bisphosphate aldolase